MRIQRWPRRRIEDVRWIAQATSTLIHFRIILRVLYSLPYPSLPQVFDGVCSDLRSVRVLMASFLVLLSRVLMAYVFRDLLRYGKV